MGVLPPKTVSTKVKLVSLICCHALKSPGLKLPLTTRLVAQAAEARVFSLDGRLSTKNLCEGEIGVAIGRVGKVWAEADTAENVAMESGAITNNNILDMACFPFRKTA